MALQQLEPEAPLTCEMDPLPSSWPLHGAIHFNAVQMRYRVGSPLVLKGLTFTVNPGERVGVCGRTGMEGVVSCPLIG